MNIEAMAPDMIVLRHASSGACHLLLAHLPIAHHQRRRRHARAPDPGAARRVHDPAAQAVIDRLKVAIVGDLLHSRVLRSNVLLLTKLGADVWLSGPPTLVPPGIERLGVHVTTSVDEAVAGRRRHHDAAHPAGADAGRVLPSLREYFNVFGMTAERVRRANRT